MDGIIVINKPKGCTSHDVVYKVKKIFNTKIGHAGTLDPNATGVLPLLVGKGTSLSKYLINHDKIYEVVLKLGTKTDTADSEGKILETEDVSEFMLEDEHVKNTLQKFVGKQEQTPPKYSAIKVNGKKLYEYARIGEDVEIEPRKIEIYKIELNKINKENKELQFIVSCSKGTYIRSLCEDISGKLGTVGYMAELKRIQVGEFNIKDSITIEQLQENAKDIDFLNEHFITIEDVFKNNSALTLQANDLKHFLNGVKLRQNLQDGVYKIYDKNANFIGTGIINNRLLKRDIIII